jgi:hypothetical protein
MSVEIFADNFIGDPDNFYSLVIEEVKESGLDVQFSWRAETEFLGGMFKDTGKEAKLLTLLYRKKWLHVFCLQVGKSFFVSTRIGGNFDDDAATRTYIQNVHLLCYQRTVDRCVRRALTRHMEARNFPVPAHLTAANDNFELGQEEA